MRTPTPIALLLALFSLPAACANAPPSTGIPYDGAVGNGPDWNMSVNQVELTIDRSKIGRAISPLIYGYNAIGDPAAFGVAALRAGGNRFTAYNWETNASNAGRDYMFQNDGFLVASATNPDAPGEAVRPMLEKAQQIGAAAVVTIPNVDYVAADKLGGGDVSLSGADYLMTRFKKNRPSASASTTPPSLPPEVNDDFVNQDEFVAWIQQNFPDLPVLYSMDNEPDLWSETHKEVHPLRVTYQELVKRNIDYARAVKAVRADAPVLGFVSYGWQGFVDLQSAPDASGNFIDFYLTKMKSTADTDGKRLIDYLDLHWYPEATGVGKSGVATRIVFGGADLSSGIVEARVQAPRSLWDPGYGEKSWIAAAAGGPIALIPRIQQKIEQHYPGTKLAFTEWNYGGGTDASGAVATADVLGIFGREGVALANVWPSGSDTFTRAAMGMFRNYDGVGDHFGDTSISAQTSSIFSSSVYASIDSSDQTRMVIVAINKRSEATTATVRLTGDTSTMAAQVWVLAGATASSQMGPTLAATTPGTFIYEMPALSVSVLVPAS